MKKGSEEGRKKQKEREIVGMAISKMKKDCLKFKVLKKIFKKPQLNLKIEITT